MNFKTKDRCFSLILLATLITGCQSALPTSSPATVTTVPVTSITAMGPETEETFLMHYEFPAEIDPGKHYLFYLHGKIIEDQGLAAISPDFGEYEYEAILEKLERQGFEVISEQRSRDTDPEEYARKTEKQIGVLKDAGVPSENITVVGASKGAGIAAIISSFLQDSNMNFVLLAFCSPDAVRELLQNQTTLYGNVLAIRDSVDDLSGSCQELFDASEGRGLGRHKEIVLDIGTGHGILYEPLDEWIQPTVDWAKDCGCND